MPWICITVLSSDALLGTCIRECNLRGAVAVGYQLAGTQATLTPL